MSVMMRCGHSAQGVDGDGNPACVICVGRDYVLQKLDYVISDDDEEKLVPRWLS